MSVFTTHTIESAPEKSKAILSGAKKALGFVPNLYANLAESPAALQAYTTLSGIFDNSSLSPVEQQVVVLTVSVINRCEFCIAAHSLIAKKHAGVESHIVDAIRQQQTIDDPRLNALATFTRAVVNERGWVSGKPLAEFLQSGFSKEQALDVILGVSMKTLSNYANHLTETEVNAEFASEQWQP